MRKTIFIMALFLGLSFSVASNGTDKDTKTKNYEVTVEKVTNVNSFCVAIAKGDFDTVKKLIELGEDVNRKSAGKTPLMYAARYNRVEIAKLLLANGAKLKVKDAKGNNAMTYAKLSKAFKTLELLKDAGNS